MLKEVTVHYKITITTQIYVPEISLSYEECLCTLAVFPTTLQLEDWQQVKMLLPVLLSTCTRKDIGVIMNLLLNFKHAAYFKPCLLFLLALWWLASIRIFVQLSLIFLCLWDAAGVQSIVIAMKVFATIKTGQHGAIATFSLIMFLHLRLLDCLSTRVARKKYHLSSVSWHVSEPLTWHWFKHQYC